MGPFDCSTQKSVRRHAVEGQPICKHGPMVKANGHSWICTATTKANSRLYYTRHRDRIAEYEASEKRRKLRRDFRMRRNVRRRQARIEKWEQEIGNILDTLEHA